MLLGYRKKLNIDNHKTSLFNAGCLKGQWLSHLFMDLATLFYNLREEVSCSVCSDLFTDPKHLSCLHSFCSKCLKGWYETSGGGDAIKCPKCQTLSKVPASGDLKDLPTSFYLNGLIDVLAIKECKKTQVTCRNCEKKSSEASYCFQCCIFYCEECLIGRGRGFTQMIAYFLVMNSKRCISSPSLTAIPRGRLNIPSPEPSFPKDKTGLT